MTVESWEVDASPEPVAISPARDQGPGTRDQPRRDAVALQMPLTAF